MWQKIDMVDSCIIPTKLEKCTIEDHYVENDHLKFGFAYTKDEIGVVASTIDNLRAELEIINQALQGHGRPFQRLV